MGARRARAFLIDFSRQGWCLAHHDRIIRTEFVSGPSWRDRLERLRHQGRRGARVVGEKVLARAVEMARRQGVDVHDMSLDEALERLRERQRQGVLSKAEFQTLQTVLTAHFHHLTRNRFRGR